MRGVLLGPAWKLERSCQGGRPCTVQCTFRFLSSFDPKHFREAKFKGRQHSPPPAPRIAAFTLATLLATLPTHAHGNIEDTIIPVRHPSRLRLPTPLLPSASASVTCGWRDISNISEEVHGEAIMSLKRTQTTQGGGERYGDQSGQQAEMSDTPKKATAAQMAKRS